MKIYFIYVTFGSLNEAKRLGSKLVKNKLAACTNIIPTIYSTYVWKNKTMMDKELINMENVFVVVVKKLFDWNC